jgi:hypothetical protein
MNIASFLRRHRTAIRAAIDLEVRPLVEKTKMHQIELGCALAMTRDLYWNNDSGVVVSGFGDNEFLPRLERYKMDGVIGGKLRVHHESSANIQTTGRTALIMAFAQREMVGLFMNGIDGDFRDFIKGFVSQSLLRGYPALVDKSLGSSIRPSKKRRLLRQLLKAGNDLEKTLDKKLHEYSSRNHVDPIVEIAAHLPKEELASMAEALVNLTSFKRHVTRHAETVGGPIDVAVISRGDGFIWIKRKQYFKHELNPHFLANYYDSPTNEKKRGRA